MSRFLPVLIILAAGFCRAATLKPTDEQISIIRQTIDQVFADSFRQGYILAEQLPDTIPGRPIHSLLLASVMNAQMIDAEDYSRAKQFFSHVDSSIDILKDWVDRNPDDAWGLFLLGSAYGYKAIIHAQKGSWLKSLIDALKAKGRYSDALKLDPTLYDAYTGLGNYHYWSTVKLGKYIPFLPDNREMGLKELQISVDSSHFSTRPAEVGLAWALLEEKRVGEAMSLGKRLFQETGGGRNSLWIIGGAYWRMGNLPQAAEYYGDLMNSFLETGDQNYYNVIFCRYRRGVCFFGMGQHQRAKGEFETILSYEISREVKNRLKNIYKKTREYLDRIEKESSGS